MGSVSLLVLVCIGLVAAFTSAAAQTPPDPTAAALWHTAAHGRGVPAVLGERVYGLTVDHHVVALSLADGNELWRRSTGESARSTEGSRVVATHNAIVVGDWDLYAYHPVSGNALWQFHPATGYGPGLFLGDAAADRVFTGSPSGSLFAVELASGRQGWTTVVEADGRTSVFAPVTDGVVVVAGYTTFTAPNTGGVVAVDAATGKQRWRFRFPKPSISALAVNSAGGPLLAGGLAIAASGDGHIWALDLQTGTLEWTLPPLTGPLPGIVSATDRDIRALAASRRRLLVGSLTGHLVAYDLETRQEAWRFAGGWLGSHAFEFTASEQVVYVPYVSGFLLAIEVESGAVAWQTQDWQLGLAWPPAVTADRVVAAGRSGFWAFPSGARTVPPP